LMRLSKHLVKRRGILSRTLRISKNSQNSTMPFPVSTIS
jgi:hypothetical protein